MWKRIWGFGLRHLYPLRRDLDLLSDMLYWPIIDILLWGITSKWIGGEGAVSAVVPIITSLVLWNVIWRSQSEVSRNLMDEIWNNNLVNLFSTPLSLKEWIYGALLLSVFKMLLTISAMVPIVWFLYSVNIFAVGLWLLPFFALMVVTGWSVGFFSAGIVLRWGQRVQTVIWTLPGILLPLSAAFFPLALLPTFLRPIAYGLPTTYVFESMRSLVLTNSLNPQYIIISIALNIIYLALSLWWFVRSFRYSISLGLNRF